MLIYSVILYFTFEFIYEAHRADLFWVVVINIPYLLVPIALITQSLRAIKVVKTL